MKPIYISKRQKKAFTLIELLIVIAIIGILFVVLVSRVDFATDKAKASGVQTDFRAFQVAFETVSKENAGFATFGWDTGDANGNRIRDSYDQGDTDQDGVEDSNEIWTGRKTYGEAWTGIYTLKNPKPGMEQDYSAVSALEAAINANLDPKLHITIASPDANGRYFITMANQARDPWGKEYHGEYITNAVADNGADRGAIVLYSDGANGKNGSEHGIANGLVTVVVPGNNVAGQDDYALISFYTNANGYGETATVTFGFSQNQEFLDNSNLNDIPTVPGGGVASGGGVNDVITELVAGKTYTFKSSYDVETVFNVASQSTAIEINDDGSVNCPLYADDSNILLIGGYHPNDVPDTYVVAHLRAFGDSITAINLYCSAGVLPMLREENPDIADVFDSPGWYNMNLTTGNVSKTSAPSITFIANSELAVPSLNTLLPLFSSIKQPGDDEMLPNEHVHKYNCRVQNSNTLAGTVSCGQSYYYSCSCGEIGTETFTVGSHVREGAHCSVCNENLAGIYSSGGNFTTLLVSWDELIASCSLEVDNGILRKGFKVPDILPEKNMFGFYFGVPYAIDAESYLIFYADTSIKIGFGDNVFPGDPGYISYGYKTIDMSALDMGIATVSDDGLTISTDTTVLRLGKVGPAIDTIGDLLLPDTLGITKIDKDLFESNVNLTGVVLNEGLIEIGDTAFIDCSGLLFVDLPSSLQIIGRAAFGRCTSLSSVSLPKNIVSMQDAFANCTGITSINIEEGLTHISGFSNCTGLTSLYIPADIQTIGKSAFSYCENLTSVVFETNSSLQTLGDHAFTCCSKLLNCQLPPIAEIPYGAFSGCSGLTQFVIPDGVTKINGSAFNDCYKLSRVVFPDSVISIDSFAFSDCWALTTIDLPLSLHTIGEKAFENARLTSLILPEGVVSVGNSAFATSDIAHLQLPSTLDYIGTNAFTSRNIQTITVAAGNTSYQAIDDVLYTRDGKTLILYGNQNGRTHFEVLLGVETIDSKAFWFATLQSIVLPNTLKTIKQEAFYNANITELHIPDSVVDIEEQAFMYCEQLQKLYIGKGMKNLGEEAFYICPRLIYIYFNAVNMNNVGYCDAVFDRCGSSANSRGIEFVVGKDVQRVGTLFQSSSYINYPYITKISFESRGVCTEFSPDIGKIKSLTSITIPVTITEMHPFGYGNSSGLKNVYYQGTEAQWNAIKRYGLDDWEGITIHFNQ